VPETSQGPGEERPGPRPPPSSVSLDRDDALLLGWGWPGRAWASISLPLTSNESVCVCSGGGSRLPNTLRRGPRARIALLRGELHGPRLSCSSWGWFGWTSGGPTGLVGIRPFHSSNAAARFSITTRGADPSLETM
jgi:hypothetical protein